MNARGSPNLTPVTGFKFETHSHMKVSNKQEFEKAAASLLDNIGGSPYNQTICIGKLADFVVGAPKYNDETEQYEYTINVCNRKFTASSKDSDCTILSLKKATEDWQQEIKGELRSVKAGRCKFFAY